MKITKRQLRKVIRESLAEGYNSMSSATKAHAGAIKRKFVKLYPDAKVGIDAREGWMTVNDKKAINMSQASGSPLTDEEMIDKLHAVYAGESVDSDVTTSTSPMDTYRESINSLSQVLRLVEAEQWSNKKIEASDEERAEMLEKAAPAIFDFFESSPILQKDCKGDGTDEEEWCETNRDKFEGSPEAEDLVGKVKYKLEPHVTKSDPGFEGGDIQNRPSAILNFLMNHDGGQFDGILKGLIYDKLQGNPDWNDAYVKERVGSVWL